MSELGHGMIPPSEGLGGVSVTSVQRSASLSLAKLAMLRFDAVSDELTQAARALVAAIALLGDRLAFASPALHLRSGCELLLVSERIDWIQRGRDGGPVFDALELSGSGRPSREAASLIGWLRTAPNPQRRQRNPQAATPGTINVRRSPRTGRG
ncbi:hypothetical protein [Streptomyces sp. YS-3]|uniref:hypothetical protein n=1 Tax=Streptomyces sp. YS-3 TaxID=3381352 RepID=UPI0038628475